MPGPRNYRHIVAAQKADFSVKIPYSHNLLGMIQWYQQHGHKHAQTDPLSL